MAAGPIPICIIRQEFTMIFTVNGSAADIASEGTSIGAILSELDERAEAMGNIIVEVRLNGTPVGPDELASISNADASGAGTVDLVAEPAADLKGRALETLLELVRASPEALETGDQDTIGSTIAAWDSYRSAFGGLFSAEEQSFLEAFAARLASGAPGADLDELAGRLDSFFGERLAELRDPGNAMLAAARVFDAIKADLSEVPVRLQTGKDAQAMRTMVLAVELIHKTVRIIPEFMRMDSAPVVDIDGATMPEFYGAFNDVLLELASAFENKDGVLIGDLAEYEIRPRLESFFSAVRQAMAA